MKIDSLAIGGFDGVHLAHQKLFEKLSHNGAVLIIEKNSSITPKKARCEYIKQSCFFYYLDDIKHLTKDEFIEKLKADFPHLKKIVVGYDFMFGKNRQGSPESFKKYFDVVIVNEIKIDEISVHSSVIREYLKNGNIEKATKFLNHPYKIKGLQIKGQGLGKKEFVPTINLEIKDYLIPKAGVYKTKTNGKKSISFIGKRESTDNKFAIETHLLENFDNYDKYEIEFVEFIRENRKFNNFEELKKQILLDIEKAK